MTVLLIEEERTLAANLSELLRFEGWEVDLIGKAAFNTGWQPRIRPDVIVCDVQLPNEDGLKLCLQLRQRDQWANIPVIFLTAAERVVEKCAQYAPLGVLVHPVLVSELLALLRSAATRAST